MSKETLRDVRIRINGLDISTLCTTVNVETVRDDVDVTGYSGGGYREYAAGEAGSKIDLDLLLGIDGGATVTAPDEDTPIVPGGSSYWNGLLFRTLYASGDTAIVDISPHSAVTSSTNPEFSATCRLMAWKPFEAEVGGPVSGSLNFVSTGPLSVAYS